MNRIFFISAFLIFCANNVMGCSTGHSLKRIDSIITIKFQLRPTEQLFLFYDQDKVVKFRNESDIDSVYKKDIFTNKAVEFRYGLIDNGVFYHHKFYLNPGDIVVLKVKNKFDVEFVDQQSNRHFIDLWFSDKAIKLPQGDNKNDIDLYFKKNEQAFIINNRRIDSLVQARQISIATAQNWKIAKTVEYYNGLLRAINGKNIGSISNVVRANADKILKQLTQLEQLKSPDIDALIYYLAIYDLAKNKKNIRNISSRLDFLLKNEAYIRKEYVLTSSVAMLKNYPTKSDLEYKTTYKRVKAYNDRNGQKFSKELEGLANNKFSEMGSVTLVDVFGKRTSLKALSKAKDELIFIDMWASWCVPCRKQTPFLEKAKSSLKDKPIRFLSISIDEENKYSEWMQALKEDKLYGQLDQYRLADQSNSPLTTFFDIVSIPRYLVITNEGEVLNDRFINPDDPAFENKLIDMLKVK